MTATKRHLHVAFAGAGGGVGVVVKDEARRVIFERHTAGEGPAEFHPWQALIQGLQIAVELGADAVTLYSHHGELKQMAKLSDGRGDREEFGAYMYTAWGLLFTNWNGRFTFVVIPADRNPAIAAAHDDKAVVELRR